MKATLFVLLLALAALALACENEESAPVNSGIEGQVLIGPQCPVVQEGTPCPDKPYQATIDVWTADRSKKVKTFETDAEGRFRVELAPGDYYLDPQPPGPGTPPIPFPQTVTVPPDAFITIAVQYDSGIR